MCYGNANIELPPSPRFAPKMGQNHGHGRSRTAPSAGGAPWVNPGLMRSRKLDGTRRSVRPYRGDIHGPPAERDVERVAAKQIDHGHENEQERGLPALPS